MNESPIDVDEKTLQILAKAKRKEESFSEVIMRLSETKVAALKQRGEKEIMTSDERRLIVKIDQTKCAGAESCVSVAPSVFALDVRQLGLGRRGKEPLGVRDVRDRVVDSETVVIAATSCPYRAIHLKDAVTGEELAGYP